MIIEMTFTNDRGDVLTVPMENRARRGLVIFNAEGITAPEAEVFTKSTPTSPGAIVNNVKVRKRNITLTFVVYGTKSADSTSTWASTMPKHFKVGSKIKMGVKTSEMTVVIDAVVERNDGKHFASMDNTLVSLVCPFPYFRQEISSVVTVSGVRPLFQFPFSNESLTENLIQFGEIITKPQAVIDYTGDTDVGMVFKLQLDGPTGDISLYNMTQRATFEIDSSVLEAIIGGPTILGDVITVDTRVGRKSITHTRGGVDTNIINAIVTGSTWLRLYYGENVVTYNITTGRNDTSLTVTYDTLIEGV